MVRALSLRRVLRGRRDGRAYDVSGLQPNVTTRTTLSR
jgi:hypothetical protein